MGTAQKRPRSPSRTSSQKGDSSGRSGASGYGDGMSIFQPPVLRSAAFAAAAGTRAMAGAPAAGSLLNKALFTQTFDIAAARVHDMRQISKYQKALTASHELLRIERLSPVVDDPEQKAKKAAVEGGGPAKAVAERPAFKSTEQRIRCLLLQPTVKCSEPHTWSDLLRDAVDRGDLGVIPYQLTLDYDHWTSREILVSVLPEEFHDDIPTGFNTAGHVAHLNLRDRFKPYKHVVAEVILDKNPQLRTVINKTDLVGTESAFRTFPYEVLAGPDDMQVEVRENLCTYRFDYSRVYWNSKLEPEHTRLLRLFRSGQVVADVMAGIGPFALPAGKRGVFVWANDMNPDSYAALCDNIQRNKTAAYVRPFNEDGRVFIRRAAGLVLQAAAAGERAPAVVGAKQPEKTERQARGQTATTATTETEKAAAAAPAASKEDGSAAPGRRAKAAGPRRTVSVPATISHFVMNLPASAITFLPHFRGLYAGHEALFGQGSTKTAADDEAAVGTASASAVPQQQGQAREAKLPIVHVHCFAPKNDNDNIPKAEVCARVSEQLGVAMTLCPRYADMEAEGENATAQAMAGGADRQHLVYVHNVRAVAPHKSMFCASFRLPAEVAFAAQEAVVVDEKSQMPEKEGDEEEI